MHNAPSAPWLADAAGTAAERGLGALYCLVFFRDTSGQLVGQRPASSDRMRSLGRIHEEVGADLTSLRFHADELPALEAVFREGQVAVVAELGEALPMLVDTERATDAQRRLGIARTWVAPLTWDGETFGLLFLLMPAGAPSSPLQAQLLGRHVAVAARNLRRTAADRKRGELDAVRWVYDEKRFLEQLNGEVRRAQRHSRPLSVMVTQVQNLEELRVRYGRFLADQLLRRVGVLLAEQMRDTDFVGAFRADGFATILVEADREGAARAERRLQASLDSLELPNTDLPGLNIQLACATATLPQDGETADELAAVAEGRLTNEEEQKQVA